MYYHIKCLVKLINLIDEDPTAVKDLPLWTNPEGQTLATVAKRVNTEKAQIKKTADPFYEYRVMEAIQKLGLPVSKPIAKVEQSGVHRIVMERIPGKSLCLLSSESFIYMIKL